MLIELVRIMGERARDRTAEGPTLVENRWHGRAKALGEDLPELLEEQQGGPCGWSRERER